MQDPGQLLLKFSRQLPAPGMVGMARGEGAGGPEFGRRRVRLPAADVQLGQVAARVGFHQLVADVLEQPQRLPQLRLGRRPVAAIAGDGAEVVGRQRF